MRFFSKLIIRKPSVTPPESEPSAPQPCPTLSELLNQYLPQSNCSKPSIRTYRCEVRRFEKAVGQLPVNEIVEDHFHQFAREWIRQGGSNQTRINVLGRIRLLLRFARDCGWIDRLPGFGKPMLVVIKKSEGGDP